MAQMAMRADPGTDYVQVINQIYQLPDEQLQALSGEAGPRGTAAKFVLRDRSQRIGLGAKVSPGAMAIPSSFPDSSVLKQIGKSPSEMLSLMSQTGPDPSAMPNPLESSNNERPTVAGAMPPPSRPADPPPPPTPVTPQPITPEPGVGLQAAAPAAVVAEPPPTAPAAPTVPSEEEDEISKDRNFAIMQAGLAILASKNRSGLGAIGEGALVGLQGYQDSKRDRRKQKRDDRVLARQEEQAAKQMDMQIQRMELEKQLSQDRMALSREEMDITRSRYDPSNPLNAAQIERDRAAAEASRASAWKARQPDAVTGGVGGVNFGKSAQGLAIARLVNDGVLTPEQGAMHLAQKTLPGPNGEVTLLRPGEGGSSQLRGPGLSNQEKDAILDSDKSVESAASVRNSLQQAMDLNKDAYSGASAEARAWIDRNLLPGEQKRGTATTEYKNIIDNQAVANLKNVFPGAISNDERKAFSELQASVNKSPEEREAILKRAIAASESVAAKEAARTQAMRRGDYFNPGAGPAGGAPAAPRAAAPAADVKSLSDDDLLKMLGAK